MTATDWHGMAKNSQTLRPRERLGWFLRSQYFGPGRDKRLAYDLAVSPRTARNLFEDHWPSDDTFAAIVRRFGEDVWRVLCAPEIAPVLAELTEKEATLARELEGLRARRRQVEGLVEGRSYRVDADAPEPAGALNLDLFEEARP
jgi:hypothetical protein